MMPPLQPKIAQTRPLGPVPNFFPGTKATQAPPAKASTGLNASHAAKIPVSSFDFPMTRPVTIRSFESSKFNRVANDRCARGEKVWEKCHRRPAYGPQGEQ